MFSEVAAAMLQKAGMNVDEQVMDAAAWARRLTSKEPPDPGGWNLFLYIHGRNGRFIASQSRGASRQRRPGIRWLA